MRAARGIDRSAFRHEEQLVGNGLKQKDQALCDCIAPQTQHLRAAGGLCGGRGRRGVGCLERWQDGTGSASHRVAGSDPRPGGCDASERVGPRCLSHRHRPLI